MTLATFAIDRGGPRSAHEQAVDQLLVAARSGDEVAVRRLLAPGARLGVYSDFFIIAPPARELHGFFGPCRMVEVSEAMDVVAARFDCARDARGEFIVDFAFCGDKVSTMGWPESGRRVLSPLYHELIDTIRRRLTGQPSRCDA